MAAAELFSRLKGMKLMLIDDDEWIRNSLFLFLRREGVELKTLESAEAGLEELEKSPYDIIIADYRLPGINGLDFLKRIGERHPHTVKILITAYKDQRIVFEASKIGIQDFIEKPFTIETIESALSWAVSHMHDTKDRGKNEDD